MKVSDFPSKEELIPFIKRTFLYKYDDVLLIKRGGNNIVPLKKYNWGSHFSFGIRGLDAGHRAKTPKEAVRFALRYRKEMPYFKAIVIKPEGKVYVGERTTYPLEYYTKLLRQENIKKLTI